MNKELLQQALDALLPHGSSYGNGKRPVEDAAIERLKQALAQQEQPSKTERQIRRMFCVTYASTSSPYMDDGEAQDNSMRPYIDFLRDSPEEIQSKMTERAIAKHKAQQEQPASVDAYVGAREDAAIWKKRALEAEELNRKFIAELNGPTYLGEPVKQDQPAQVASATWTDIVAVNLVREGVNKHRARELAAHFLTLFAPPTPPAQEPVAWLHGTTFQVVVSKNRPNSLAAWLPLFAHPAPTQPALSDEQILDIFHKVSADGIGHYMTAVGRAIEAHCQGGQA